MLYFSQSRKYNCQIDLLMTVDVLVSPEGICACEVPAIHRASTVITNQITASFTDKLSLR